MAKINTRPIRIVSKTHEGAPAARINAEQELRRAVMACLLWEDTFYESGVDIATRIADLAAKVDTTKVSTMAVQARGMYNLRHAPLWLNVALARRGGLKAETLADTIQRADELSEFVAMYWKDGKQPLAAQVKKGLAKAFTKFDAYQLAKYDRENAVRLRDVLFMVHAKPKNAEQGILWKQLVDGTLPSPDTWEVGLSTGSDKKETFERLLREGKLGYLALLRNLRNMEQAGVDKALIESELRRGAGKSRVLPFRFVAAARAASQFEPVLEEAMFSALAESERLTGKTLILVDVSGSMNAPISGKSDLSRIDAASALAMLVREICEDVEVWTFSNSTVRIAPRRGFALRDAINGSQLHSGTALGAAVTKMNTIPADRLIVITDEQSADKVSAPTAERAYMINVAAYKNGVGYGKWTHIDGFSEAVVRYIQEVEKVTQ